MNWFDLLMYWSICGTNMKAEFDSMSKKETLRVIDECVSNKSYDTCDLMSLYKIAMTSLEERI